MAKFETPKLLPPQKDEKIPASPEDQARQTFEAGNKLLAKAKEGTKKVTGKKEKVKKWPSYVKENLTGEEYFENYLNRCVERATEGKQSPGSLLHGGEFGLTRYYYIWKNAAEYWSKNHPDPTLRKDTSTFNGIENWDPKNRRWKKHLY